MTNDDASAGSKGEYKETQVNFASPVSLTSGVTADITSVSLTAGDWIVSAFLRTVPNAATTTSQIIASIGASSATLHDIGDGNRLPVMRSDTAIGAGGVAIIPLGVGRISIAVTTTVYFSARVTFAVNTMGGAGIISAWRVR